MIENIARWGLHAGMIILGIVIALFIAWVGFWLAVYALVMPVIWICEWWGKLSLKKLSQESPKMPVVDIGDFHPAWPCPKCGARSGKNAPTCWRCGLSRP